MPRATFMMHCGIAAWGDRCHTRTGPIVRNYCEVQCKVLFRQDTPQGQLADRDAGWKTLTADKPRGKVCCVESLVTHLKIHGVTPDKPLS